MIETTTDSSWGNQGKYTMNLTLIFVKITEKLLCNTYPKGRKKLQHEDERYAAIKGLGLLADYLSSFQDYKVDG